MPEDTRGAKLHGSTLTYFFIPFNAGIRTPILVTFPEVCRRVHFRGVLTKRFQLLRFSLRKELPFTSPDRCFVFVIISPKLLKCQLF